MKKKLIGLVIGSIGFMLVACASQDKEVVYIDLGDSTAQQGVSAIESNEPEGETSAEDNEIYEGLDWSTPWVDSDKEGVFDATGFDMAAPADAVNVVYSYLPSTGLAQMNFTMEDAMWIYRIQRTDALMDISDVYCEWDYEGETKVAGMDAMEYSYASEPDGDSIDNVDCTRVINWYDVQNSVTHSLVIMGKDLNGMDTVVYAENLFNMAVVDAPKSDGIAPVSDEVANGYKETDLYKSYLGLHVSSYDGSDILIEEGGENDRLKVNVGLFRLCNLDDGSGIYENGVVSFSATDPSGNIIRCCIYYNSDNSLCLEVEDSTWSNLPNGTIIEGFDN